MGGEDHPGALPGLLQDLKKEPPSLLVQGRFRLVQKPEVGPQEEEAGEGEALLHPAGEGGEGKVRGEGEAGQGRLPVPLRPVEAQVKEEVLPGGEVAVEGRGVGEEEGPSPSLHPAPGGPYKPRHEAEEGGLARAVRAQEGHHLSPLQGKAQIAEDPVAAKALGNGLEAQEHAFTSLGEASGDKGPRGTSGATRG